MQGWTRNDKVVVRKKISEILKEITQRHQLLHENLVSVESTILDSGKKASHYLTKNVTGFINTAKTACHQLMKLYDLLTSPSPTDVNFVCSILKEFKTSAKSFARSWQEVLSWRIDLGDSATNEKVASINSCLIDLHDAIFEDIIDSLNTLKAIIESYDERYSAEKPQLQWKELPRAWEKFCVALAKAGISMELSIIQYPSGKQKTVHYTEVLKEAVPLCVYRVGKIDDRSKNAMSRSEPGATGKQANALPEDLFTKGLDLLYDFGEKFPLLGCLLNPLIGRSKKVM